MAELMAPGPDLDLGLVRAFVIVAQGRHFGRAASLLHLTQSSLSRQIRRLEQQLGVRLLDRTPQGADLTESGKVFLPLAITLLDSTADAITKTRMAAGPQRLVIGYVGNLFPTSAVKVLRDRYPDADIRTIYIEWDQTRQSLIDRRIDVAITRRPLGASKLRLVDLYDEDRVLALSSAHRLAGQESVTIDELRDEVMPRMGDPVWDAFWRVDPRPDGSSPPEGPVMREVVDIVAAIASGEVVALLPSSVPIASVLPGLTTVAVNRVEPCHVILAARADDRNPLVKDFLSCAQDQLVPH